jgi:hypothetical protein
MISISPELPNGMDRKDVYLQSSLATKSVCVTLHIVR